jgi:hypothetical protein
MVLRTASAPDELLRHIPAGADLIVPLANDEAVAHGAARRPLGLAPIRR